jgi:hypothetical protein
MKGKTVHGSRVYFSKVVQKVVKLPEGFQRRHDCESQNTPSLGSHKPDYLLRSAESSGEQSVIVVGEIKGINDADREFPDEDVGQILDFIQEVLIRQGWRTFAYGFLTDGIRFEFFRGERKLDRFDFKRSGLFSKNGGWAKLLQLLLQSNHMLGFIQINVDGWKIEDWLGSGRNSSVFSVLPCNRGAIPAVCKIFFGDIESTVRLRENEYRALITMQDDEYTPKLVQPAVERTSGEVQMPILLVTTRGEKIGSNGIRLPIIAYAPLVRTLRRSHSHQLCHNDICPDNMFAVQGENNEQYSIILNDWGSSMTFNELAKTDKVCTHTQFYNVVKMGPAQDLAALLRSVFVLTQLTFSTVKTVEEVDAEMHGQWSWGKALSAALDQDYDTVERFLITGNLGQVTAESFPEAAATTKYNVQEFNFDATNNYLDSEP